MKTWLGLDIGGANLKAARSSGEAQSVPFALWKRPDDLPAMLASLVSRFAPADAFAVTMTAELCDCFETKAVGVRSVLRAVRSAVGDRSLLIWGVDGKFHAIDETDESPALAAASNWLALATIAARIVPQGPGILIDIGSTTADLIPILDGSPAPIGLDDTGRLRSGTLVYAGARRTPVGAIANSISWRGAPIGLAAQFFATTLDVYLTLGAIPEAPLDLDTADGRPATLPAARDRLARMVGADREGFSGDDALELAIAIDSILLDRLFLAAERVSATSGARPRVAVISGSGEFLARRVAERLGRVSMDGAVGDADYRRNFGPSSGIERIDSLADSIGPVASVAACAFAVAKLAEERE